jgi:hypothetical protein
LESRVWSGSFHLSPPFPASDFATQKHDASPITSQEGVQVRFLDALDVISKTGRNVQEQLDRSILGEYAIHQNVFFILSFQIIGIL